MGCFKLCRQKIPHPQHRQVDCLLEVASQLHNLGAALQEKGNDIDALTFYNESISARIEFEQTPSGARTESIECRLAMIERAKRIVASRDLITRDNKKDNGAHFNAPIAFTQVFRIDENTLDDKTRNAALTFYNMGLIQCQIGSTYDALKFFQTVVAMLLDQKPEHHHFPTLFALLSALNNIGCIFYTCDKKADAAKVFAEALKFGQVHENECGGLIRHFISPIVRNQAFAMNSMGQSLEAQGMNLVAISVYENALEYHKMIPAAGDALVRHEFSALARNLGALYSWEGECTKAMHTFELSIILLAEATGDITCPMVTELLQNIQLLKRITGKHEAPAPAA